LIWGSFTSLLLAEASRERYVNSTGVLFCHTAPAGCHGLTGSAAPPDRLTPAALLTASAASYPAARGLCSLFDHARLSASGAS
jgi:hypothetical protein